MLTLGLMRITLSLSKEGPCQCDRCTSLNTCTTIHLKESQEEKKGGENHVVVVEEGPCRCDRYTFLNTCTTIHLHNIVILHTYFFQSSYILLKKTSHTKLSVLLMLLNAVAMSSWLPYKSKRRDSFSITEGFP